MGNGDGSTPVELFVQGFRAWGREVGALLAGETAKKWSPACDRSREPASGMQDQRSGRDNGAADRYDVRSECSRKAQSGMSTWPNLSRAPIVEGLIDLRVERSQVVTLDALKRCADALANDYPAREELSQFRGEFSLLPDGGSSVAAQPPAVMGLMLRSANGKWVAQFRLDGFTLSRLEPYTSWDELTKHAKDLWNKYTAVAQPQKIVRVAARFINRIALPQGESFDKTFTTTFNIAASLPQAVAGFLLRFVIPFEREEAMAIVTQALSENSQDCIFDLDVFAPVPGGISDSDAWSKLEQLRGVKNRLFFESLTPDARARFQ